MTVNVSELASQISGTLLTPVDDGYEENTKRWVTNAEKRAAVVVLVTSPADVGAAVLSLRYPTNVSRLDWRSLSSVGADVLLQECLLLKVALSSTYVKCVKLLSTPRQIVSLLKEGGRCRSSKI
jgi:hypothetical protein